MGAAGRAAVTTVGTEVAAADPLAAVPEAGELVATLTRIGQTVATAESLTAGLLAATIAGVPGASVVLRGGVIVYATDLKHRLAGVSEDTLATDGPVAAAGTAEQLAVGARTVCGPTGDRIDRRRRAGPAERLPGRHRLPGAERARRDRGGAVAAGRGPVDDQDERGSYGRRGAAAPRRWRRPHRHRLTTAFRWLPIGSRGREPTGWHATLAL